MSLLERLLWFPPIVFLIMVVYVAPKASDARGLVRLALPKTGKVLGWTAVIVVAMLVLEELFLP